MERLDLTTPVTFTNVTSYTVASITLDYENTLVYIRVGTSDGDKGTKVFQIDGPNAKTILNALNKLSTPSLHKRLLGYLNTNGLLLGTVSGLPD